MYASSFLSLPRLGDFVFEPIARTDLVCCAMLAQLLDDPGPGGGAESPAPGPAAAAADSPGRARLPRYAALAVCATAVPRPGGGGAAEGGAPAAAFTSFTGAERAIRRERVCGVGGANAAAVCAVTRALLHSEGVRDPAAGRSSSSSSSRSIRGGSNSRRCSTVVLCVGSPAASRVAASVVVGAHYALVVHWQVRRAAPRRGRAGMLLPSDGLSIHARTQTHTWTVRHTHKATQFAAHRADFCVDTNLCC